MSSRYLCLLFLTLGLVVPDLPVGCQDLNYTHYTVESGLELPSNEVYRILFDNDHILWATTDRGIWKYDGHTGKQFTVADGLKENTNFKIFLDPSGNIWASSINNYLYQIERDSVHMHPMSERIHNLGNSVGFIQQITVRPDSSFYLAFNRPGLLYFKNGEIPETLDDHKAGHSDAILAIRYKPDEFYWDMIRTPDTNPKIKSKVTVENGWIYLSCGLNDTRNNYRKDLCPIGENEFLFSYYNKIFHIRDGKLVGETTFSEDIFTVYADKKGDFWVGLQSGGAARFLHGDLQSIPIQYLKGESVSGICEDHEGNYWFSTTTNGIFQANTLDISVFRNATNNEKDNVINSLASDGVNIYLGTQTGLLFKGTELPNQRFILRQIKIPSVDGPVRRLIFTPENHLIIFNHRVWQIDTLGHLAGIGTIPSYPYEYLRKPNGEWMVSFAQEIDLINNDRIIRKWNKANVKKTFPGDSILYPALVRVRAMYLDPAWRFWMGSQNSGLISSRDSVLYAWREKDTLLGRRINDIIGAGGNIWASIADYGLAVIRPDSTIIHITQKNGLSSDIIDVLFPENDSVIWAGTNNGLNRIQMNPKSIKPEGITYYTMREGLPSNRIFQIIKHKNQIWVGTTHGAIRLNPDFIKPLDILPVLVTGPLLVNGKSRELTKSMILDPDDNNLLFKYKAITYRKPSTIRYRYKLTGIDKDYIITDNLESRYPDLSYGNYQYCLNASYTGTFDLSTERQIDIQIRRHWYETLLSRLLYGLILLALIFFIFRKILRVTKHRELEKRQLLTAEKRSLLAQMNPHFIFNSLNSIQHYIIQNDHAQANNFLINFSGLIRNILDNSKKKLISLNEEISVLTLYLSLEKLRFENEFDYEILKDHRIDYLETMIPPMLIQPFVENAIWHGLMPLKAKGLLQITFTAEGEFYRCCIEDNGIGREKSLLIKGQKNLHISTGIVNVEERIALLNKMNKKGINLTITDLIGSDGTSSGTRVDLVLPNDLNY